MRLKTGMKAPGFEADAFGGKKISLDDYSSSAVRLNRF